MYYRKTGIFSAALLILLLTHLPSISFEEALPADLIIRETPDYTEPSKLDDIKGETLTYDISFLWFSQAATGFASFKEEGDGYIAILEAETRGFVGFFTGYRKHRYISHMKYIPEKNKLQTRVFERQVIIREKEEKTINILDYDNMLLSWKDYKEGELIEDKKEFIPSGTEYEDILSAYYNFRLGNFGPIKRERNFQVSSIPEKGQSTIKVRIPEQDQEKEAKLFGEGWTGDLLNLKVQVPKEIFKSKHGEVDVWVNKNLAPTKGIVRDYIGFGDIKCSLVEKKK